MNDLTILYYTANKIPVCFATQVRAQLKLAANNITIRTIDRYKDPSILKLYSDLVYGLKDISTPYVALCEDDTLYPASYFSCYRPPLDTIGYNANRWNVYAWSKEPAYLCQSRAILGQCIAPTILLTDTIAEKLEVIEAKYGSAVESKDIDGKYLAEPGRYESFTGARPVKMEQFLSPQACVVFNHRDSYGFEFRGKKKKTDYVHASYWEPWGDVNQLLLKYFGEEELKRQRA